MNRLVSRFSKINKQKFLFSENALEKYPFFQLNKYIQAEMSKDDSMLERAAQAVFYWPSFNEIFTDNKNLHPNEDDMIPTIQFVKVKRKKKKASKSDNIKSKKDGLKLKVLGESVSDEAKDEILPIEVSADKSIKKAKIVELKTPNLETNIELKDISQKTSTHNWSDWNYNNMNAIKLSDYTNWLNKIDQTSKSQTESDMKKLVEEPDSLKDRATSSISLNEEVISEPLADLLADQGHKKAAINMYQRLSLLFPEKSSLFALKIQALKSKK